jgi:hypothetical protein
MDDKKNGAREGESLHHRAERHAMYVIIDAVFGLSLGLGAFSLTELPIGGANDLFVSIGFFGFSYFIIFMSWMSIRRHFEEGYIVYGSVNMILFLTGFFIAIMPIPIRIILMQSIAPSSPEILEAAFMLYSICLSATSITMGIFSFAFSKQSWGTVPWRDFVHQFYEGVGAFVMGFVFLISAFLPFGKALKEVLDFGVISYLPQVVANMPSNIGFWLLGGITLVLPAAIIARVILQLKRPIEYEDAAE